MANDRIPYCTQELTVSILPSLGLTSRAPRVTWNVASMSPSSSSLKNNLENDVLDEARDMLSFTLPAATIRDLKGRTVTFQATVTNFLDFNGSNTTAISFGSAKELVIEEVQDIYTISVMEDFTLQPLFRNPYCPGSTQEDHPAELEKVSYECTIYEYNYIATGGKIEELEDCSIPKHLLEPNTRYSLVLEADKSGSSSYSVEKEVVL